MTKTTTPGSRRGHQEQSSLFLLRLWWAEEETPGGLVEHKEEGASVSLQGRLLHVTGRGAGNFESWPGLVELLRQMLPLPEDRQDLA